MKFFFVFRGHYGPTNVSLGHRIVLEIGSMKRLPNQGSLRPLTSANCFLKCSEVFSSIGDPWFDHWRGVLSMYKDQIFAFSGTSSSHRSNYNGQ